MCWSVWHQNISSGFFGCSGLWGGTSMNRTTVRYGELGWWPCALCLQPGLSARQAVMHWVPFCNGQQWWKFSPSVLFKFFSFSEFSVFRELIAVSDSCQWLFQFLPVSLATLFWPVTSVSIYSIPVEISLPGCFLVVGFSWHYINYSMETVVHKDLLFSNSQSSPSWLSKTISQIDFFYNRI